jgi:diguanylate cyclase (GGDEF)-like protein/PAS domain S-box-containing protein
MLAGNLAVVALFVLAWAHARYWLRIWPRPIRVILFAVTMGVGTIASMSMSVEVQPGFYFDLRASLLAVAAFFGGWPAALVSALMAAGYRLMMGGAGAWAGAVSIGLASGTGLALRLLVGGRTHRVWHMVVLGLTTPIVTKLSVLMLPAASAQLIINTVWVPTTIISITATMLAGLVYLKARQFSEERDLLAAALSQAPDYAYVKTLDGRFAATNDAVARFFGLSKAEQLIGRSDLDLHTPERAKRIFETEQAVLATGDPLLDLEEMIPDASGEEHWYSTTKVPLHNPSGRIIGLAGVTRDITAEKQLRQELMRSSDTLTYALAEMSDGLAMFDSDGFLVFCNDQYRDCFPLTGKLRQPGAHLRDILHAVVESGEQTTVPKRNAQRWIDEIVANLHRKSEEEVNLLDGRWLQVRTRPTSNGATMIVVSDVTRFKHAEMALHSATDQLKHLVRTDSLTDLLNRRAFDAAIDAEIRRSSRAGTALSLLLVDVDRFKAYNDQYGHPAGDECLRQVAQHLRASLKRPADIAARYGGEEFTAILPDTDEDGAYLVAEGFRRALAEARLPHIASERGYVTASVGVATYMPENLHRSALELIQTADSALYSAKAAGRDRVFGTRMASKERKYAQI